MIATSHNHESNGKSIPNTTNWNRVILLAGFERKNWNIYSRHWHIILESNGDNPNISDFIRNADLTLIYLKNRNLYSFGGSHNFNLKCEMRGSAAFFCS